MTSPILRQPNKVKPSTSEASKHALFTLEATIERIVFSREKKSCNKRLKHVHLYMAIVALPGISSRHAILALGPKGPPANMELPGQCAW